MEKENDLNAGLIGQTIPDVDGTLPRLNEGDVFHFRYSQAEWKRANGHDLNWCFDGQVVFRKGQLCDTYWGYDSFSEQRIVKPEQGELTFICNLAEVEPIREYETLHYAEADVFNLSYNHGCHRKFVIRKGAQPSAERMLEAVRAKEAETRREIESSVRTMGDLAVLRHRLESGDVSRKPWWKA